MSATEDLRVAVTELHGALDAWHAAVEGVAAESGDDATEALADPRLEAAQDTFYEHLGAFETATLPVLGLIALEGGDAAEAYELDAAVDDFTIHLVARVPDGGTRDRLDDAMSLVDDAGTELGARLTAAGFQVLELATTRGELEFDDADEDE